MHMAIFAFVAEEPQDAIRHLKFPITEDKSVPEWSRFERAGQCWGHRFTGTLQIDNLEQIHVETTYKSTGDGQLVIALARNNSRRHACKIYVETKVDQGAWK